MLDRAAVRIGRTAQKSPLARTQGSGPDLARVLAGSARAPSANLGRACMTFTRPTRSILGC